MLIRELLSHAALGAPAADEAVARAVVEADAAELQSALDAGLGPMIYRATSTLPGFDSPANQNVLLSADLTARVLRSARVASTIRLLELFEGLGVTATVLKGISISEQYYREPHERPMSDIDILAAGRPYAEIEFALLERGFKLSTITMDPGSAHGVPLQDPIGGVWVEIHTQLFPESSPLLRNVALADPGNVGCSVASSFCGRPVIRLSDELQLIYIAAFWTRDLSMHSIHPSFIVPLLDAVILLAATRKTLDWARLLGWLANDQATASLYVMLAFLTRHELIELPAHVIPELARRQEIIGRAELRILEELLDRYLLRGRSLTLFHSWHVWHNLFEPGPRVVKAIILPWRLAFPPSYSHRYDPQAQTRRFGRLFKRLR